MTEQPEHPLIRFLHARLDEDEAAAKAWLPFGNPDAMARAHVARHDPARVLREVEAKRKLFALHSAEPGQHPDFCWHDKHELPCPTLRLLAEPYRDHSDYPKDQP